MQQLVVLRRNVQNYRDVQVSEHVNVPSEIVVVFVQRAHCRVVHQFIHDLGAVLECIYGSLVACKVVQDDC